MVQNLISNRLRELRAHLVEAGLYGFIVPRTDPHQSEATAAYDGCLEYISGFTGSAGSGLILRDKALIFVDGRYQVQVRNEVDLAAFEVHHEIDDPLHAWLQTHARETWRIGVDPMRISCEVHDKLTAGLARTGGQLVNVRQDPFEKLWIGRPDRPVGKIRAMPLRVSGETSFSKRARIVECMSAAGADMMIESLPDNISWLLNVRGSDVPMNPVPHSFLILRADASVDWFVDHRKLDTNLNQFELAGVTINEPEAFFSYLKHAARNRIVAIDPAFTPEAVRAELIEAEGTAVALRNPITSAKAIKNAAELGGYRACHIQDGVALANFLSWLTKEGRSRHASDSPVTELEAETRLLAFRAEQPDFLENSFRAISASGPNAAMCHYRSHPATNAPIGGDNPYLIDSGGQYCNGTTDVTRTIILGEATEEVRAAYTAVLRGLLSLLMIRFPIGTQGHQLDAFARRALWDIGLDFDHTTGHGVGHNLLIHEQPHQLSKDANPHPLVPGNIVTIEPGYYREGVFGLRTENQVEVLEDGAGFCRFSSLTVVPIELDMADLTALTKEELEFLDQYHDRVRSTLEPLVLPDTRGYLLKCTRAVSER